jgi:L-threonylcarbamoyladenylate synthase
MTPRQDDLENAIDALRAGQLIIYPTETFYGIGADAMSLSAIEEIFAVKGREPGKPIALIAADTSSAFALWRHIPDQAKRLADAFWPGPLTLVLPARSDIPDSLLGPDGGVAVRVSSHPRARALAAGLGRPITATSANRSGQSPAVTSAAARIAVGDNIKVLIEGGTLAGGLPSSIVACEGDHVRLLRAGVITEPALKAALGGVEF